MIHNTFDWHDYLTLNLFQGIMETMKFKNTEEILLRSPFEFFARSLLSSMGNRATGRPDMSSRHHARQSIRVIYCISDSSNTHPFFLSLLSLLRYSKRNAKDIILLLRPVLGYENLYSRVELIFPDKLSISML